MGISVRKFLGWEPGEVTTFEYDDDGRMVRAITVREPEYSHLDRRWLRDSFEQDSAQRSSTGWLMSEATDPANRYKFYTPPPATDFAKLAEIKGKEEAKAAYEGKIPLDALIHRVEMKD